MTKKESREEVMEGYNKIGKKKGIAKFDGELKKIKATQKLKPKTIGKTGARKTASK